MFRLSTVAAALLAGVALVVLIVPVGGLIHTGKAISFQPTSDGPIPTWLIAGPFSDSGDNALFKDYLWWAGGEATVKPRDGDIAAVRLGRIIRWQRATTDSTGTIRYDKIWPIGYHSTAYAYTEVVSESDRRAVATVLGGMNLQIWLNGNIVYENRLLRNEVVDKDTVVLHLQKGVNSILVKAQELVQQFWQMQLAIHLPAGKLFVNETNTIIPDLVASRELGAWGQVEVANASDTNLPEVTVEVQGSDFILPAHSTAAAIEAGTMQRIPVWIAGRGPVPDREPSTIRLRVSAGGEDYGFEFTPRVRKLSEFFVTTYRSGLDGSVQPYSVWLPIDFAPARVYSLIVLLHGSTVDAWGQNIFAYSPKTWAIEMAPHDRGDNFFREAGQVDLDEAIAEAKRVYKVDPDRIYLSGHSMGGYGAWYQATRRPDMWAAIAAQSGATDELLERPDMGNASNAQQRTVQEQIIRGWSPISFAENLRNVPAYVLHGRADPEIPPEQSRQMCARLAALGYKYVYDEAPGQQHWWGGGPPDRTYGTECVDKPAMTDFLREQGPRILHPRHVVYATDSLRYNRAYWVVIDEMETLGAPARIEAAANSQDSIDLTTSNVTQVALRPDGEVIAAGRPMAVKVNGLLAYSGSMPASGLVLRRTADGSAFGQLDGSSESFSLQKSHELFGPVADAFNSPFLFVTGTGRPQARQAEVAVAATECAHTLARDWMLRANGIVKIKRDVDVTADDIESFNLVLFGDRDTNTIVRQINDQLPIRFSSDGIALGRRTITTRDAGLIIAVPNPMNRNRYVVIFGGRSARFFQAAGRMCPADLPDYAVFDPGAFAGKKLTFIDCGFFDKSWRLPD